MRQYYAHPRNLFWPIMGSLCNAGPGLPYSERLDALRRTGLALWDVLQACDRTGSLDGNIVMESEVANDLPGLLSSYPSIFALGFNGGKAWTAFRRLVNPVLDPVIRDRLKFIPLPSTSPANAGASYEEKFLKWQVIRQYLEVD
jgi:double-stranded uracil-DNA glycosylase